MLYSEAIEIPHHRTILILRIFNFSSTMVKVLRKYSAEIFLLCCQSTAMIQSFGSFGGSKTSKNGDHAFFLIRNFLRAFSSENFLIFNTSSVLEIHNHFFIKNVKFDGSHTPYPQATYLTAP